MQEIQSIQLSHLDGYCTIMIEAGSTKEFQRIGLIMLKYGSSLMEHFSTFNLFSFVQLDPQALGFMDVFLSFLGCR